MTATAQPSAIEAVAQAPGWRETWKHVRYVATENPVTLGAFILFLAFVLLAIVGPWVVPYDPLASNTQHALKPPSAAHWFGTDALGRDILSRIVVATRLDFGIAISAVIASFVCGSVLGSLAGFYGGWSDRLIGRLSDTIMAFPLFVLAMGIVAALGNTVTNIILATAIINLPFYIRVSRAEVNVRRNAGYVEAAGRSFIGLGVRPPDAEWGIMVAEGATYIISGEWWVALFPGAVLMLAVFCFNLLGDGLRDMMDPRMRT
jgi:peptide/nickel transport system permease protein